MAKGFTDDKGKFRPTGNNSKKLTKEQVMIPKRTGSFMITGRGLIPNFVNTIPLQVGGEYNLGSSSSPKHIILTGVNDQFLTYRTYPYGEDIRIQRDAGEPLIREALETMAKLWKTSGIPALQDRANRYERILDGDPTAPRIVDVADLQPVSVEAFLKEPLPRDPTPAEQEKDQKMWYHAESFGGVGGIGGGEADEKGRTDTIGYSIVTTRGQLDKIRKDPLFKEIKITEDKFKGK